jgi:hypothetical protein
LRRHDETRALPAFIVAFISAMLVFIIGTVGEINIFNFTLAFGLDAGDHAFVNPGVHGCVIFTESHDLKDQLVHRAVDVPLRLDANDSLERVLVTCPGVLSSGDIFSVVFGVVFIARFRLGFINVIIFMVALFGGQLIASGLAFLGGADDCQLSLGDWFFGQLEISVGFVSGFAIIVKLLLC